MEHNINKKAFTLVEMMVAALITAFIAGYAFNIYMNSQETMRHTVSQSQIQADIRLFLDHLESEMMCCYCFDNVDTANKKFSFYSFTYSKVPTDNILNDDNGVARVLTGNDDAKLKVKKFEYIWNEDCSVTQKKTPGWLYFLKEPMVFQADSSSALDDEPATTVQVLKDITEFEVKGYEQVVDLESDTGTKLNPITPAISSSTTFIVLRLHAYKDEKSHKRDEEIDVVTKFYSAIRLADAANQGYFCSTDSDKDS